MMNGIENACALTGHRKLREDFSEKKLEYIFIRLIEEKSVEVFYCGMALGFDLTACKILCSLRKTYPQIKIIASIPCPEQSAKFSYHAKREYDRLLKECNEQVVISPYYDKACMHVRNRYMVDRAKYLVAYLREERGGTASTVRYAQKQQREIFFI